MQIKEYVRRYENGTPVETLVDTLILECNAELTDAQKHGNKKLLPIQEKYSKKWDSIVERILAKGLDLPFHWKQTGVFMFHTKIVEPGKHNPLEDAE